MVNENNEFHPMIEPERRQKLLQRLNRIEGQVKGVKKMIEQDRACADILMQIASAQQALQGVAKIMVRNYLEKCVTQAIKWGDTEEILDELMDVIFKYKH